jgi:transposase
MNYVGIDIAKSFHVATIINENGVKVFKKAFRIENDIVGFMKYVKFQ